MKQAWQKLFRLARQGRLPDFGTHFQNAWHNYKQRPWRSFDMISMVSTRPPILLSGVHPAKLAQYLQPSLAAVDLTIFYRAGWSLEDPATLVDRISAIKAAQQKFPRHRYLVAANTPREVELVKAAGIRAEFLHENAFQDEFTFKPALDVPKVYDAIIDAQIAPYKRLELAAKVRSLLVITFVMRSRYNPDYGELIRTTLQHADWANGPFWTDRYRKLNREEVAETYRKARVGLCLSPIEGGNMASIQYLLSGLAVVSTESQGGRDVFFEPDYAAVVPTDPAAIADAVAHYVRTQPAPTMIRARTLEKIWSFRKRFSRLVEAECAHPPLDEVWWREFTQHRPIAYHDLRTVALQLAAAQARG
jgi:glycosyltransferase involved in cell wall biosynthesis